MFTRRYGLWLLIFIALLSSTGPYVNAQTNKVPLTHETMWMMKRVGACCNGCVFRVACSSGPMRITGY